MQDSSLGCFKTLREIDGKYYVEFAEILELFKELSEVPNFFAGTVQALHKAESSLEKINKAL